MKDIKDLIPFCVPTEGLTQEQGNELFEKFVKAGAYECEVYDGRIWKYYGVDYAQDTVNWDSVEAYDEYALEENVTVVPYEDINKFLELDDEDLSSTLVVSVSAQPDEVITTPECSCSPEDEDASTDSVDTSTACDIIETLRERSNANFSLHFESGECNVEFSDGTYRVENEAELQQLIEAHNFLEERAV